MIKLEFEKIDELKMMKSDFINVFAKGLKVVESEISLKSMEGVIQLSLVSDDEIKNINAKYRGINKHTDVVSLSYINEMKFPGKDLLGEIFISLETAEKQAKENDISLQEELLFLFAHGLLHVFGYDHMNAKDKKRMFDLQEKILV